jgi:hypothetical protein
MDAARAEFSKSFDYQINIDQWQPKAVTRLQENQDNWWDALKQLDERVVRLETSDALATRRDDDPR